MRVAFFASDKPREQDLARAFIVGTQKYGDAGSIYSTTDKLKSAENYLGPVDVAVMVGVKSIDLYRACQAAGIHTIMIDKGYQRHRQPGERVWEYWRCAIDAHHPTAMLMNIERPHDRMAGVKLARWHAKTKRGHIVIAGSSAKYHRFYDLPEPTEWATKVVAKLRKVTRREIVYRPKPSWHDAVAIKGTTYSGQNEHISDALWGAHALVTHGSNACFEAILAGVPCIILGDGVAKPISSTDLVDVNNPLKVSMSARQRWLASLAYWQWNMAEFESGEAWASIRPQIGR